MALLDLQKLTAGLSRTWTGYLRDWDRSLRSGNYPETTRYNYLLAAAQLARYLGEYSPDPDADEAAGDPCGVTRAHVEAFQAWMVVTRSASTALNKYKCLQQFFRWLQGDEQAITRSPMERVRPPKTPTKLVPVLREVDTAKVPEACRGKGFVSLRDEALIRLYANTGARLSEVGNLLVTDVDMNTESVHFHGKGAKDRRSGSDRRRRGRCRGTCGAGQPQGRVTAEPVAGRPGRGTLNPERNQDPFEATWPGRRGGRPARAPVAAQLRPRVEAGRRGHWRPDAAAGMGVGGHAAPVRRQRRRGAGHGDSAAHRHW